MIVLQRPPRVKGVQPPYYTASIPYSAIPGTRYVIGREIIVHTSHPFANVLLDGSPSENVNLTPRTCFATFDGNLAPNSERRSRHTHAGCTNCDDSDTELASWTGIHIRRGGRSA